MPQVWAEGFTGDRNVRVCTIDTGVDIYHPDLVDNLWTNPKEIAGNGIDDDGDGRLLPFYCYVVLVTAGYCNLVVHLVIYCDAIPMSLHMDDTLLCHEPCQRHLTSPVWHQVWH